MSEQNSDYDLTVNGLSLLFYLYTFLTLYFLFFTEYDLLVLSIPKVRAPKRPAEILRLPIVHKRDNNIENLLRIDVAHYDEPTELPDIDNFDYNKDRAVHTKDLLVQSIHNDLNDDNLYGEDKIVGGFAVDINLYPYHASYGSNCGGAIIDKRWVFTAGHCG